jgi:hypothetical protein
VVSTPDPVTSPLIWFRGFLLLYIAYVIKTYILRKYNLKTDFQGFHPAVIKKEVKTTAKEAANNYIYNSNHNSKVGFLGKI